MNTPPSSRALACRRLGVDLAHVAFLVLLPLLTAVCAWPLPASASDTTTRGRETGPGPPAPLQPNMAGTVVPASTAPPPARTNDEAPPNQADEDADPNGTDPGDEDADPNGTDPGDEDADPNGTDPGDEDADPNADQAPANQEQPPADEDAAAAQPAPGEADERETTPPSSEEQRPPRQTPKQTPVPRIPRPRRDPGTVGTPRTGPDERDGAAPVPSEQPEAPEEEEEEETAADDEAPVESRLLDKTNVPPFWFDLEYTTHRTRALALPPIFFHRSPKPDASEDNLLHVDLSFTFGWSARNSDKRRWLSLSALFYGSFSERETVWGAAPLLMGYKRVGEQFNFGQFPLFWWWGNRHVKNFLAIPFHFQQKAPDEYFAFSALLFWYGHKNIEDADLLNDRRHFVAAPVFWRFRRGQRRVDVSPLYIGGYNKLEGLRHRTLFPFFHWQSREFGNARELWTPFWVRRRDAARRKSSWAIPPLLTFRHRNPDLKLLSVTPLFWRAHDRLRDGRTTVVGPFAHYRDPRQRNTFLFPFWWQFRDRQHDVTTSLLLPLGYAKRSPKRMAVWTPLAGGMRGKSGAFSFGIPPLLTFGHRDERGRSIASVFGTFWHAYDPEKQKRSVVLGPLAYGIGRRDGTQVGFPPLLSFFGRRGSRSHQVITPLFWHFRDTGAESFHDTWVVPPFYARRNRTGWHAGLPPLVFFGGGRERYAIAPFLLSGHHRDVEARRALTVSPVFVRSKGPDHRTLGVLGLAWDVARKNERHTVVAPFYYRRQTDSKVLHLSPLGGALVRPEKTTWLAGPVYGTRGKRSRGFGILPLAFHHSRRLPGGGVKQHTVVPPLFLRRRTPTDDLDVWTPLIWRSRVRGDKPRRGLAVVPFYFRQRQPGGVHVDAGPGFFWSRTPRRRTHTILAGTFFHRLSRKRLHTGIAPLYWWMDSEDERRLVALPSIVHLADKAAQSHTTIAVPLWFDRQRNPQHRTWTAFPFVVGWKRDYDFLRFSLAPPAYLDFFRLKKNHRFVGVLPFLFRYEKCGFREDDDPSCRYRLWGSFPLFLAGKDGQGRLTHSALGLYYYDRTPKGYKLYTLPFGINNQPGDTLGWYVGPLGVKTTKTHRRVMLLPLYYRKKHRIEDESTTVIAPPVYIGQHNRDRRWFEAALLVWQFRQKHKVSTTVLPPLFFHSHSYAERRLTWLLPLFLRDNDMADDETWTAVFPGLYVQRRKGENLDLVQFPLVWHIERGENQGTFGAFLWWDIRTRGNVFQTVPGLYTRYADRDSDTKVIGPGLGWWTRGRGPDAGDRHWRALFGLFGAGVEDGRAYTSVFGARIDRGPAEQAAEQPAEPAAE